MSKPLGHVPFGVHLRVDDVVVELRVEDAPAIAVAHPRVILPCETHLRGRGPMPARDEAFAR